MNKIQFLLVVIGLCFTHWMVFMAGNANRRMPKETNLEEGWWNDGADSAK